VTGYTEVGDQSDLSFRIADDPTGTSLSRADEAIDYVHFGAVSSVMLCSARLFARA